MPISLTADSVPPQFLESVFLVGKVPWRASQLDPRVSYALYIPGKHYLSAARSERDAIGKLRKLPLVVNIHGTLRDTSSVESAMVSFADSTPCAILAPLFPAGLDNAHDMNSYKVLRSKTLKADLVLLSILDEVKNTWSGIDTEKVYMAGFSGGGQFAHRFLYLYPERLRAVSVGAPGRSTSLSGDQNWPLGIGNVKTIFDRECDIEAISRVHIQMIVGDEDDKVHGGDKFWEWVKETKSKLGSESDQEDLPAMTSGRLTSLRSLHSEWHSHGIEAEFKVVPGVRHVAADVREDVLEFLARQIEAAQL